MITANLGVAVLTIQERIDQATQQFEQKKQEREEHLKLAEDCLLEMTKLQGAWRALNELVDEPIDTANNEATVIEAVAETQES